MLFVVNTRTPLFVCSTSWLATVDCVNYMYYKQDIMDSLCIKIDGNNAFILPERNEAIFHYAIVCTLVSIMNRICYLQNVINVLQSIQKVSKYFKSSTYANISYLK